MTCHHWFWWWPPAIRQQAITSTNVDQHLWQDMASLDHNELITLQSPLQTYYPKLVCQLLKTMSFHDANFAIIGGTADCHHDNLQCHQWWQSWHHDYSHFLWPAQSFRKKKPVVWTCSNTISWKNDGLYRFQTVTPDDNDILETSSLGQCLHWWLLQTN